MPRTVSRTIVGDVDVAGGGDLAGDVHLAGGDEGLDGDPAARVLRQHGVEDRVADLVGDLVRVALGHRLGREEAAWHSVLPGTAATAGRALWTAPAAQATGATTTPRCDRGRCGSALAGGQPGGDRVPDAGGDGVLAAGRQLGDRRRRRRARRRRCPARPKTCPAETSLTTSRSQPLRASLARAWVSTSPSSSPVSAAKPTTSCPGARLVDQLGEDVGVADQRHRARLAAAPFFSFVAGGGRRAGSRRPRRP